MDLSTRAVRNYPGESDRLHMFAASPAVAGFTLVGGLATLDFPNEAFQRFTFVTAHVFAFPGFVRGGYPPRPPGRLHG